MDFLEPLRTKLARENRIPPPMHFPPQSATVTPSVAPLEVPQVESNRRVLDSASNIGNGSTDGGRVAPLEEPATETVPATESTYSLALLPTLEAYQAVCSCEGFTPTFCETTARFEFEYLPYWSDRNHDKMHIEHIDNECSYLHWLCGKIRDVLPTDTKQQSEIVRMITKQMNTQPTEHTYLKQPDTKILWHEEANPKLTSSKPQSMMRW